MTTDSDVRKLRSEMKDLAGAVEDLAEVVERMLKGITKDTDARDAGRASHTARQVKSWA